MGISPFLLGVWISSASVPAAAPAAPDPVRPAMWMISDGDTKIYLFGTFHALDGSANWFKDRVSQAFEESDQLVLETMVPKAGTGTPAIARKVVPTRQPPTVVKLAPSAFIASTQMVMDAGQKRGMSITHGADAALRLAAEASGKPVAALESLEFQINMFSAIGRAPQPQVQLGGGSASAALSAVLAKLQDAWVRGDTAIFEPMLEQMNAQSPNAYRTMFVERNARWADWIAARLGQPGTVFVAVGAGHLAGRDSVQNQLATLGVSSVRVN